MHGRSHVRLVFRQERCGDGRSCRELFFEQLARGCPAGRTSEDDEMADSVR